MSILGIIQNVLNAIQGTPPPPPAAVPETSMDYGYGYFGRPTVSGKRVSVETAKSLATAYRCVNILSDDIASMPLQVFQRYGEVIEQVKPDAITRNLPYLLELQPNRWMTPFIFKKTLIQWLINWGNAYIWQPLDSYRELFILRADVTYPVFDEEGSLWFKTRTPSGAELTLPGVEICHLMINSTDGIVGRSVITYAAETMGRQLGAHETQNRIHGNGLNPAAILWISKEANEEAREKMRQTYLDTISGSDRAGGVAIFDPKITKFESVTMKASDAQFLESIEATDAEIANFFGMPLYKLNMGKQSYESNEQQKLDYLQTTLNPYLVQMEQAGRLSWLRREEQSFTYLKFNRESLLQTDAKTRAAYLKEKILSGQMSPNEARAIEDISPYPGGDKRYMPANMGMILEDGSLQTGLKSIQEVKTMEES
ncbi:MAG TPA: phage portal protein [Bellilinea sp.]|nr:phage portal protein [Bellilinea sp.]